MLKEKLFCPAQKKKILVLGDMMLDSYINGEALRISPEAPVPVVAMRNQYSVLGGAANVARNLAVWNVDTFVFGILGDDEKGHNVCKLLEKYNIHFDKKYLRQSCNTITKVRVIATNQHVCRIDIEDNPANYAPSDEMIENFLDEIPSCDAVIISDYAKGFLTEKFIQAIIDKCNALNKICAIDPKPRRMLAFKNPYLLKPNRKEALELAEITENAFDKFPTELVCRRIYEKFSPQNLVITMGAEGMILVQDGKITSICPAQKASVYDVSGAGDTVVAMLTLALSSGFTLSQSAQIASKAAAIVIGKFGTSQAEISEICEE